MDRVGCLRPPTSFPNTTPFPVNVQSWSAGRPVPFHCLSLDLHCILLEIPPSFVCISPPFVGPSPPFVGNSTAFRLHFTAFRWTLTAFRWKLHCLSFAFHRLSLDLHSLLPFVGVSPPFVALSSGLALHLAGVHQGTAGRVGAAARPLHERDHPRDQRDAQPCLISLDGLAHPMSVQQPVRCTKQIVSPVLSSLRLRIAHYELKRRAGLKEMISPVSSTRMSSL